MRPTFFLFCRFRFTKRNLFLPPFFLLNLFPAVSFFFFPSGKYRSDSLLYIAPLRPFLFLPRSDDSFIFSCRAAQPASPSFSPSSRNFMRGSSGDSFAFLPFPLCLCRDREMKDATSFPPFFFSSSPLQKGQGKGLTFRALRGREDVEASNASDFLSFSFPSSDLQSCVLPVFSPPFFSPCNCGFGKTKTPPLLLLHTSDLYTVCTLRFFGRGFAPFSLFQQRRRRPCGLALFFFFLSRRRRFP